MGNWVQILTVGTNLSLLIIGIKVIRHLTRMEFRVGMMWHDFLKRHKMSESNDKLELDE